MQDFSVCNTRAIKLGHSPVLRLAILGPGPCKAKPLRRSASFDRDLWEACYCNARRVERGTFLKEERVEWGTFLKKERVEWGTFKGWNGGHSSLSTLLKVEKSISQFCALLNQNLDCNYIFLILKIS